MDAWMERGIMDGWMDGLSINKKKYLRKYQPPGVDEVFEHQFSIIF